MTLGEFLKMQMTSAEPWNCSTMAADWCIELGYPDFAFEWRAVTGPCACDEAHIKPGDLLEHWRCGIGTALPAIEDDFDAGDIAVIEAMGLEAGAIFTGGKWALRGPRALHFLAPGQVRVLQAWRP